MCSSQVAQKIYIKIILPNLCLLFMKKYIEILHKLGTVTDLDSGTRSLRYNKVRTTLQF